MASIAGAIPTGVPNPQGVALRSSMVNLVMVNHEQELQAEKFAKTDFVTPFIRLTLTAVFGQGINIDLYRDKEPDDDADPDGMIDTGALKKANEKPKPAAAAGGGGGKPPPPGAKKAGATSAPPGGGKKRKPPSDDSDEDEDEEGPAWEEDRQAPYVGQPSAVGRTGKEAESIPPTKRPPIPRYPETDSDETRQKIPFSEDMRKYIAKKWNKAGKALFEAGLTIGPVACRITKETDRSNHKCFGPVATHLRRLFFQENTVSQIDRRWFVEYTDRRSATILVTGDGKIKKPEEQTTLETASVVAIDPTGKAILMTDPAVTVQDNENNRGIKLMDGTSHNLIFVFYQPDAAGNLTSPVFQSSEVVSALKSTRFTETYTNFRRAQPTHVIATGPKQAGQTGSGTSGREQFTPALYAQGDVLQERKDYTFQQTMEEQKKYQLAAQLAMKRGGATVTGEDVKQYMEIATLMSNMGTPHFTPPNINAVANIYAGIDLTSPVSANAIVLPQGQTMMGGPMSEGSANFVGWTDWLRGQLCAIWEVPPQKMDPSGAKFAADGEMVDTAWTAKVREMCNETAEYLSILFSAAYEDRAAAFTKIIRKALKDDTDTVKRAKTDIKVDKEAEGRRLGKLETTEAKALNDVLAGDITKRKQTEKDAIRKSLRVEVSFNITLPTGEPTLITQLLSMDGIDKNTAIAALGEKAGLPRNMLLLTDEARAEQRRQRLQEDTDTMHANMPPPVPLNAEGKPKAKQAPPQKPPAKPSFEASK